MREMARGKSRNVLVVRGVLGVRGRAVRGNRETVITEVRVGLGQCLRS